MNFQLDVLDGNTRGTVQSLLPPSAKNLDLLHGFTFSSPQSPGQTYRIQTGEHVTAAGDGKVTAVKRRQNSFRHSVGLLDTDATWQITIHHGFNIYTTVQGMATVTVQVGTPVVAGHDLGTPLTNEIYFQTLYRESPFDPASISRFFRAYDSGKLPDKGGQVRQGPDIVVRESEDVQSWSDGDIHYFVDKYCRRTPWLLSIDFAGTGAKSGFAVIGNYGTDFWNVYTHSALTTTTGTNCVEIV